jgi:hypothetical protein
MVQGRRKEDAKERGQEVWKQGCRGWGCNRWWVAVMLLMLVQPVEATGTAIQAAGVAGAVALTAASVAGCYWERTQGEVVGDLKLGGKQEGTMRIMATNLRRVKREKQGQSMTAATWEQTQRAVEDAKVDMWAASDTGLEDGNAPGQAALWSAGRMKRELSFGWGGEKGGWTHQQGHRGRRGLIRGGVFLAVQEQWRAEMHEVKTDRRGWGRYVMREMLCINGASVVVVSIYLPTRSAEENGGAWSYQEKRMRQLKEGLEEQRKRGQLQGKDKGLLKHLQQQNTEEVGEQGGQPTLSA